MVLYLSAIDTSEMPIVSCPVCTFSLFCVFKLVQIHALAICKAAFMHKHMLVMTGQAAALIAQIRRVLRLELVVQSGAWLKPRTGFPPLFRLLSHNMGLILYLLLGLHSLLSAFNQKQSKKGELWIVGFM